MQQADLQNLDAVWQRWHADALNFLHDQAPRILIIVLEAVVLLWLLRMVSRRLSKAGALLPSRMRSQQLRTLSAFLYSFGAFLIIFFALLQILSQLGINVGPLLASAGVAGLAIGFGAQTLVKDIINGFFILLENQYDIGDSVRLAGVEGVVENMTLRHTAIREGQGALSIIPNGQIGIVSNLTRDWAQVSLHVSAAYSENSDRIVQLLKEVGQDLRNDAQFAGMLVADPQVPGIERVSSHEVDYLMLVKTRPGSQHAVSRELRRRIKDSFDRNHVEPGGPGRMFVMDTGTKPPASQP